MYENMRKRVCKMDQDNLNRIQQINEEIVRLDNQRIAGGISLSTIGEIGDTIKKLEDEREVLEKAQLAEDQAADNEIIQKDHAVRVSSVAIQFDDFLDNMDLGGMTFREVIGGVKEYQLVSIELKKGFMSQAEKFSTMLAEQQALSSEQARGYQERETQLQRQNEFLQGKTSTQAAELEEITRLLNQERLERANAEQSRDNAVAQIDEANKQIAQQKGHIDDLRNEIALGARGAINVVDTAEEEAQKKDLAEQIRKERTIYDVQWVDEIKRNKKKAKLAATGEEIEFPWTVEGKYFVIPESEVSQFRQQYAIAIDPEIPSVAEKSVQADDPAVGVQFQTTTSTGPNPIPAHASDGPLVEESPITRIEFNELKKAVDTLFVKQRAVEEHIFA